jgi:hemolysin III
MSTATHRVQSAGEEFANTLSHGAGAALAAAGCAVLITLAALGGDPYRVVSLSIYGASLFLVFLSSTLYHGLPYPWLRPWLHLFDHVAIYLLIAGTYTPFALVTLRGPWGWSLFGAIWGIAAFGIVFRVVSGLRFKNLATALYALMGWGGMVVAVPLVSRLPADASWLLLAGGLSYTAGIAFFVWERLPYHHLVWHLLVLLGAGLHFAAVLGAIAS